MTVKFSYKTKLRDALDGLAFAAHQCGENGGNLGDDNDVQCCIKSAMEWADLMEKTNGQLMRATGLIDE